MNPPCRSGLRSNARSEPALPCWSSGPTGQPEKVPNLAVACGPNVYIYRNQKPYFKYSLPVPELDVAEASHHEQVPMAAGRRCSSDRSTYTAAD